MSEDEVLDAAWEQLLAGAEGYAEDNMDEDGDYPEEDWDRIFDAQFKLLTHLKTIPRPTP